MIKEWLVDYGRWMDNENGIDNEIERAMGMVNKRDSILLGPGALSGRNILTRTTNRCEWRLCRHRR